MWIKIRYYPVTEGNLADVLAWLSQHVDTIATVKMDSNTSAVITCRVTRFIDDFEQFILTLEKNARERFDYMLRIELRGIKLEKKETEKYRVFALMDRIRGLKKKVENG